MTAPPTKVIERPQDGWHEARLIPTTGIGRQVEIRGLDVYDPTTGQLRASSVDDIAGEAWGTVNSNVSRAFSRPRSGRVAIKVMNHFGDEMMKVFAA